MVWRTCQSLWVWSKVIEEKMSAGTKAHGNLTRSKPAMGVFIKALSRTVEYSFQWENKS